MIIDPNTGQPVAGGASADDQPPIERFTRELRRLMDADGPHVFMLEPLAAVQLAGLLQLARRHPNLPSSHSGIAAEILETIREYFADCPTVLDILRRGDDVAQDVDIMRGCDMREIQL